MTFTDADLKELFDECKNELESIGYSIVPVTKIGFSSRMRTSLGVCKTVKDCYFDYNKKEYVNPAVIIEIKKALSELPRKYTSFIKTLIMHECIHAVKTNDFPFNVVLAHGAKYDAIKEKVEAKLGYCGIDDDEYYRVAE